MTNRMKISFCVSIFLLIPALASSTCSKPTLSPFDDSTYYSSADRLSGEALKAELNSIIGSHISYSYTPCTWDILKEADEDPDNSDNVIGIYTRRSIPKSNQDAGGNTPDYWNREHIWSKSHGFPNISQDAYTDAHHLRACDKSVNNDRSDHDFAYGGEPDDECTDCREGNGTWEAPDEVKGDVARIMFYMATRYEGNDSSGTPDLELVDELTDSGEALFGDLCDLVNWHLDDPVSQEEMTRNNVIYN